MWWCAGKAKGNTMVVASSIQNHWPQSAPAGTPLCPANTVPCHRPYGLIVAGRSTGGGTVGKTLALLGGELQALLDFLSYQMYISKTHMVAAWIDVHKVVPTVHWCDTAVLGRSFTTWLKCLPEHAGLPMSSDLPAVSFQRLKLSQGLLFSAGALALCLKSKRMLLSHKEQAWGGDLESSSGCISIKMLKKAVLHFAAPLTVC